MWKVLNAKWSCLAYLIFQPASSETFHIDYSFGGNQDGFEVYNGTAIPFHFAVVRCLGLFCFNLEQFSNKGPWPFLFCLYLFNHDMELSVMSMSLTYRFLLFAFDMISVKSNDLKSGSWWLVFPFCWRDKWFITKSLCNTLEILCIASSDIQHKGEWTNF